MNLQLLQFYNREVLTREKDTNWFVPLLTTLCVDLRIIASMVNAFYVERTNLLHAFRRTKRAKLSMKTINRFTRKLQTQ